MTLVEGPPHLSKGTANKVRQVRQSNVSDLPHLPASPFRGCGSAAVRQRTEIEVRQIQVDRRPELVTLRRKVERFAPPNYRDPEWFGTEKTELAQQLRSFAENASQ